MVSFTQNSGKLFELVLALVVKELEVNKESNNEQVHDHFVRKKTDCLDVDFVGPHQKVDVLVFSIRRQERSLKIVKTEDPVQVRRKAMERGRQDKRVGEQFVQVEQKNYRVEVDRRTRRQVRNRVRRVQDLLCVLGGFCICIDRRRSEKTGRGRNGESERNITVQSALLGVQKL